MAPHRRQLREPTPSRLSPHAVHSSSQFARQDRLSWEKELLQMQIASSALIKPLGHAESASIADPRIIAEVTSQAEEAASLTELQGTHGRAVVPAMQESKLQRRSLELQKLVEEQTVSGNKSPKHSIDKTIYAQNPRSIASPFFAAAQQFTLLADSEGGKAPPPPLAIHDNADPEDVYVGLALQRQTETAEMIIPSASFTSLASSPTLPDHAFAVLPLSPQTTAKGFLTADSFKHEPGTTLLDCTDPTPNQSIDLDNGTLKNRLAQLLPDLPFPPNKRVKRNLSNQLSSLSEGQDGADESASNQESGPGPQAAHHNRAPGPVSESDAGGPKAASTRAPPSHWPRGLRISETGALLDGETSQGGDT